MREPDYTCWGVSELIEEIYRLRSQNEEDKDFYRSGVRQGANDFVKKLIHKKQLKGVKAVTLDQLYWELDQFLESKLSQEI